LFFHHRSFCFVLLRLNSTDRAMPLSSTYILRRTPCTWPRTSGNDPYRAFRILPRKQYTHPHIAGTLHLSGYFPVPSGEPRTCKLKCIQGQAGYIPPSYSHLLLLNTLQDTAHMRLHTGDNILCKIDMLFPCLRFFR